MLVESCTGGWAGGPDGTCRGHWLIPLLKKKDYISRFVHVLAPVHAILLCIIQARNSSNYVRHPYAGAFLSSARADVETFLRRHCRRRSKKLARAQANVQSRSQSRLGECLFKRVQLNLRRVQVRCAEAAWACLLCDRLTRSD